MRNTEKASKRALSLVLCLILLVSAVAMALTVNAAEAEELADTSAETYYLWGENTNSPSFSGSTPTGTFTYDSSKGYYYCDVTGASNDYCFVVSTVSNSASRAQQNQAVTTVSGGGRYYVQSGNYSGKNCMHLWNPSGDPLRIYFTSPSIGLTVINANSAETQPPTQKPTTQPATQKPTSGGSTTPTSAPATQPSTPGGKNYIYCENEAGWSNVYCYMWVNGTETKNAEWPGVKMANIGNNIWRYEVTNSKWNMVIFNIGSNQTQTANMNYPGAGYIYNNKTGAWEIYDTSPLQVTSFTTDLEAPQYNGVGITLNAEAQGAGTVYYKFSVTGSTGTTLLSDFSTKSSALWIPQVAGTYTLTYDFRDASGNTNQRTKQYVIEDGSVASNPYIKTMTPAGGEILRNNTVNLSTTAGGGITGTNLLFYKYTIKNANGSIVNVPYYTLGNTASFVPTVNGAYTVTVSVQASDNKIDERTYSFTCVGSYSPTEAQPATQPPTQAPVTQPPTQAPVTQPPTQKPTQAPATQPPTQPSGAKLLGDADDDDDVNAIDVTYIQRYELGIPIPTPLNVANADVDFDGEITIIDATLVQRYIAEIFRDFHYPYPV